jgi:hypothetical protein
VALTVNSFTDVLGSTANSVTDLVRTHCCISMTLIAKLFADVLDSTVCA